MKDTLASPGLPAELPHHLRWAEAPIRAALGALDQPIWHFSIKHNLLIGARRWPHVGVDTLAVVAPDVVVATRHVVDVGQVWGAQGTVERMVREIEALGAPEGLAR